MAIDPERIGTNQGEDEGSETNQGKPRQEGLDRRTFLKSSAAAGAALRSLLSAPVAGAIAAEASLMDAEKASAQYGPPSNVWDQGLMTEGGVPPFRLPSGALDYLDRNEYSLNMKVISYSPGLAISVGEPLVNMWAKGARRVLPGANGFVDVSNPLKPEVINKHVFKGGHNLVAFNTQLKKWILLTSAEAPMTEPSPQYPHGKYDPNHPGLAENRNYKGLRGIRLYDITNPEKPSLLSEYSVGTTGHGTHMNFYDGGRYASLDCGWTDQLRTETAVRVHGNGIMFVDVSDPMNVKEMSRWWAPGQMLGEEEEWLKYRFTNDHQSWTQVHGAPIWPVRPDEGGRIAYGGYGAFGFYVFDISDIRHPKPIGHTVWEWEPPGDNVYAFVYPIRTDAAHPQLRNLAISTTESMYADGRAPYHPAHMIDINDPHNPKIIGNFPRPMPDPKAPYADFIFSRGRLGEKSMQAWVAPGRMRPELAIIATFTGGVQVYDISDPTAPKEVAYYVPPRDGEMEDYWSWWRGTTETVFVEWDRKLIWVQCHAGTYCLSCSLLGEPVLEPRKIEEWSVPHVNAGWDG